MPAHIDNSVETIARSLPECICKTCGQLGVANSPMVTAGAMLLRTKTMLLQDSSKHQSNLWCYIAFGKSRTSQEIIGRALIFNDCCIKAKNMAYTRCSNRACSSAHTPTAFFPCLLDCIDGLQGSCKTQQERHKFKRQQPRKAF